MITILFGAGAEVSFGLAGGGDFSKNVIGLSNSNVVENMNAAIKKFYKEGINKDETSWYPDYINTPFTKKQIARAIAISRVVLDDLYNVNLNKSEYENKVDKLMNELLGEKNNEEGDQEILNSLEKELENLTSISYMTLLDRCFHTIINPTILGSQYFWRVVSCYTRAYLLLVSQSLYEDNNLSETQFLDILKSPKEIMQILRSKAEQFVEKESYYKHVKKYNKKNRINIITTNYTPFAEVICDLDKENIAYVNGRFGLFESARNMEVIDIEKEYSSDGCLFPYVFVQSGVKPIVEKKQLVEYKKVLEFLDSSNVLFIVGFQLSMDDNHISSLVRSFINEGKKVVVFNYDNQTNREFVGRVLRIKTNEEQLEIIDIDSGNSVEKFSEKLQKTLSSVN